MRSYAWLVMSLIVLSGCSRTVLVTVPPRMDLRGYETLGIIEFTSNSDPAINTRATRQFQEHVQAAQPGTRFVELGNRETVLAATRSELDVTALRKIGAKYGVAAVFVGDIAYSDTNTKITVTDITKLEGGVRTEVRGDISSRLLETRTGASVWSSSAWARRPTGRVDVSMEEGVSAEMNNADPRQAMLPKLVYHLTQDFRSSSVRQAVK